MWDFPTTPPLNNLTSTLSQILTSPNITSFLLGSTITPLTPKFSQSSERIDISSWQIGNRILISAVNLNYIDINQEIQIDLGATVESIENAWWGEGWDVATEEKTLVKKGGMVALGWDLFVVILE